MLPLNEDNIKKWMQYGSVTAFIATSIIYLIGYLKLSWL
ncbi:hypothetical protein Ga0466249_005242 [Sporomusaceae bacterium BoRhaA]|nr:hypothetical protein [Pelorhabdus rhamnosifermentans]